MQVFNRNVSIRGLTVFSFELVLIAGSMMLASERSQAGWRHPRSGSGRGQLATVARAMSVRLAVELAPVRVGEVGVSRGWAG